MRAVFYERHGPADVLAFGEAPCPQRGPGEVRVRVHASGLNPADWKMGAGTRGDPLTAPSVIPHHDGAGIIDAVGPGVRDRVGERVWLWSDRLDRAFGTAAEHIVVGDRQAMPLPDHMSFAEGACLGIPALTAVVAARRLSVEPGQAVLVTSGAGSVSRYAIQILKARGARVLATASTARKAACAASAGADAILPADAPALAAAVSRWTEGQGVDALLEIDLAAHAMHYPSLLKAHARVAIYGTSGTQAEIPAHWLMRHGIELKPFLVFGIPEHERTLALADLMLCLGSRQLSHNIAAVLPLEQAAEAHRMGEAGSVCGKIVLAVVPDCQQASRP